jgi:hypothetical protein
MRQLRILVGCEMSGAVRRAFRARGHDAWSCDLLPSLDNSPFHLQEDVFLAIRRGGWDIGVFFPSCTDLARSGAKHFALKIADGRQPRAVQFVKDLWDCGIPKIAI